MRQYIEEFFVLVERGEIEIYNEFSLQHELGIFLRNIAKGKKVQFERNVSSFGFDKVNLYKKEIDLSIYSSDNLDSVVELKYPRNGQHPEQMFSFCKDIAFLEQLVFLGFKSAYFIAVVDDKLFYSGKSSGIYGYFRNGLPITGEIKKPTGSVEEVVVLQGSYVAEWKSISEHRKYCLIQVTAVA